MSQSVHLVTLNMAMGDTHPSHLPKTSEQAFDTIVAWMVALVATDPGGTWCFALQEILRKASWSYDANQVELLQARLNKLIGPGWHKHSYTRPNSSSLEAVALFANRPMSDKLEWALPAERAALCVKVNDPAGAFWAATAHLVSNKNGSTNDRIASTVELLGNMAALTPSLPIFFGADMNVIDTQAPYGAGLTPPPDEYAKTVGKMLAWGFNRGKAAFTADDFTHRSWDDPATQPDGEWCIEDYAMVRCPGGPAPSEPETVGIPVPGESATWASDHRAVILRWTR